MCITSAEANSNKKLHKFCVACHCITKRAKHICPRSRYEYMQISVDTGAGPSSAYIPVVIPMRTELEPSLPPLANAMFHRPNTVLLDYNIISNYIKKGSQVY